MADSYNVNEGATLTADPFTAGVLNNDSDEESANTALTATLVAAPAHHSGAFTLNANGTFTYVHDGSETTTDSFTYQAGDGNTVSSIVTVMISVTPDNDAPLANNDAFDVNEGATLTVSTFATGVIDNDADEESANITLTASLVAPPAQHSGAFTLNPNGTFTYTHNGSEATTDSFTYKVSDGLLDSNTATVSITINPQNDPPTFTSANTASVPENTTTVHTVSTADPDGGARQYTVTGGADQSKFSIDLNTGALTFNAAPNFEVPTDIGTDNGYVVQVTADDQAGGTTSQTITVTLTNVDEGPNFTSSATPSANENGTAVITVSAVDPEGATVNYSKSGGADAIRFSINASTGALTFVSAPNFEVPVDANGDNIYLVQVTATDQTAHSSAQNVSVTVTNVNDPPSFPGPGAFSVPENTTFVTTFAAADPDAGTTLNYTLSGSADQVRFSVGLTSGTLTFNAPPNFEAPADIGANNVYDVNVKVSDGLVSITRAFTVTVTDVVGSRGRE